MAHTRAPAQPWRGRVTIENVSKRLAAVILFASAGIRPGGFAAGGPRRHHRVHSDRSGQLSGLSPREQALAFWLSRASIAIDPIVYDQLSRFGLRQKRVLEAVVINKEKVDPAIYAKGLDFTKLFWGNKGNHNELISQKFLPKFTEDELRRALEQAGRKDLHRRSRCAAAVSVRSEFRAAHYRQESRGRQDICRPARITSISALAWRI